MTNTKFRKRALLSSVAMLLVALIALGSATFAWFAANPNAEAHGLKLKTTASSGLVIKTDTDATWSHNALLGAASNISGDGDQRTATFYNVNLTPASQNQGTGSAASFYTTEAVGAGASDSAAAKSVTTLTPAMSASGPVYKESVYFRLSDGAADASAATINLTGITIARSDTYDTKDIYSAVRVAVAKDNTVIATFAPATISNKSLSFASVTSSTKYSDATKDDFNSAHVSGEDVAITAYQGPLDTSDTNPPKVDVYVYLDGEDAKCFSNNVGTLNSQEIIKSIQVDFTLASVTNA